MANKVFRMFAAMTMLLLYVSVLAAGDVVALTCECRHHKADVHTDFAHVHTCDEDCHHGKGESHDMMQLTDHSCCNHNHSNSIALYTQPRSADDDQQERQSVLMAVVTDVLDFTQAEIAPAITTQYEPLLLPPLASGYARAGALRAPPQLV
ncbi:MAG: hypothetical protein IJA37_05950 [Alistipes sp.]|nr:hypothetical protein [Alistipes sp.]